MILDYVCTKKFITERFNIAKLTTVLNQNIGSVDLIMSLKVPNL